MNIYTIFTITLSVAMECSVLIYFSNTVMKFRNSRWQSNIIIIAGYIIYGFLCWFEKPALNITCFAIITLLVLKLGFKENFKGLFLKVVILMLLMMIGELFPSLFMNEKISSEFHNNITNLQSIIFAIISKVLYSALVFILKYFSKNKEERLQTKETLWVLLLPFTSCLYLVLFNKVYPTLDTDDCNMFIIIAILLLAANFIVYIVCDHIIEKNSKIQYLQKLEYKQQTNMKSYELMKKKYNDLKIMVHDFNKYCNSIESMLHNSPLELKSLIQEIKNRNKGFLLIEYTNNKALDIVLSQKSEECSREGIDFQIYTQDIDLSFMTEFDTIAIFANLMDNAIESCRKSKQKKIFLSIYGMNDSYTVIRLENSSDKKPIIHNGFLRTSKPNTSAHGFGMESIKRALRDYDGSMRWDYDADKCVFTVTIIAKHFDSSLTTTTNSARF